MHLNLGAKFIHRIFHLGLLIGQFKHFAKLLIFGHQKVQQVG